MKAWVIVECLVLALIFIAATFTARMIRLNLDGAERLFGYVALFSIAAVLLPLVHRLVSRVFDS